MANSSPILIAGAGIAGLATAIGLARKGFAVTLLDRRPVLSEAGAGIQIGPNGVKALECIGVREAVEAVAFKPVGLTIRQGASGAKLTTLPWGAVAKNRYGAPFLTLLRTELQAALLAATRSSPGIELVLGFEVARIDTGGEGVTVKTDDGRGARGSALIGADGLWSRVRAEVGPIDPKPTGYVAYRAVIARAGLPAPFDAPEAGIWLGRTAHVVHYPVRGGDWLNLVVVVGGRETTRDWDELGQIAGIAPHLSQWPINLRDMLARARPA